MFFFFFNDTATTEIYTLSLHDALPISSRLKSCATNSTVKGALSKHVGWSVKIWSCSRAPGAATAEGEGGLLRHRAPQKGRWSFLVSDNRVKMESFGEQRALILGYAQGRCASLLWRQQGFMGSVLQSPRSQWLAGYCVQSARGQKSTQTCNEAAVGRKCEVD